MNLARLLWPRNKPGVAGMPAPQALDSTPINRTRLVVLDLETSGLDLQRDQILSIGAVAITHGVLHMADHYGCTVFRPNHQPSQATVLHEIAPSHIQSGQPVEDALSGLMRFAGTSVLFAFHAGFDQHMLSRGLRKDLGYRLQHRFIDVAAMAPMLFPDAAEQCSTLDDWQRHFGLANNERHNASADAQVTAEILLILLNRLARQGTNTLAELHNRLTDWRRLERARTGRL